MLNVKALSLRIIYLNCMTISAIMDLLRVHTEISWSHSTINDKVYNGTSQ